MSFRRGKSGWWVAVAGVLAGAVVWLAMVPQGETGSSGTPRITAFWIVTVAVAGVLGFLVGGYSRQIAGGMGSAQLIAAVFTAPRGDGDGLWLMWFPVIAVLGVVHLVVAALGGRLRQSVGTTA